MKLPILPDPRRPIDLGMARTATLLNQFATPGLGSLVAGRWLAGVGQLAMACAGFLMFFVWFVRMMIRYYRLMDSADVPADPFSWLWWVGVLVFLLSWLWSLVTSIQLLGEARCNRVLQPIPDDSRTPPN